MYVRCTVRPWMFWTCIKNNFAAAASQHWSPPTKPRCFQQQLFTQKIYFAYPVQRVNSKVVFAQFIDKTSHQAAMEIRPLAAVQKKQSTELESTGVMPVINSEEGPEERHRYSDRLLPEVAWLQSFYMAQSYLYFITLGCLWYFYRTKARSLPCLVTKSVSNVVETWLMWPWRVKIIKDNISIWKYFWIR